jgi:hypothetical protein
MKRLGDYYTDVMFRRRYDNYYYRPYYNPYPYYRPYYNPYPYNNYIYDSQLSNVSQNISNFGYMYDVQQNSIVNQLRAERRRYP